jgi:hypothetical protein
MISDLRRAPLLWPRCRFIGDSLLVPGCDVPSGVMQLVFESSRFAETHSAVVEPRTHL